MKASLIIPCWNSERTLDRCIECVRSQTFIDFEAIFVNDGSTDSTAKLLIEASSADNRIKVLTQTNKGVSAARNAGLAVARGEFIFFVDPDDAFSSEMLEKGIRRMECDKADYCVFQYREKNVGDADFHVEALKGTCHYDSNDEIVSNHLTRMFGYSSAQVKAWYDGAPIFAHRVQGSVCWCVYRREIIESNKIRFDERIHLYEDAMFNCEYMLAANRMTAIDETLYDYIHYDSGAIARLRCGKIEIQNKFELLRKRKELDAKSGGRLGELYVASCVFSIFEILKIVLSLRVSPVWGLCRVCEYARDAVVREALRKFPISRRKPLLALCVIFLRVIF